MRMHTSSRRMSWKMMWRLMAARSWPVRSLRGRPPHRMLSTASSLAARCEAVASCCSLSHASTGQCCTGQALSTGPGASVGNTVHVGAAAGAGLHLGHVACGGLDVHVVDAEGQRLGRQHRPAQPHLRMAHSSCSRTGSAVQNAQASSEGSIAPACSAEGRG